MGIICDRRATEDIKEALKDVADKIIYTDALDTLEAPLNTHPDIQIHFLSKELAVCPPEAYDYYRKNLPNGTELIKGCSLGRTYTSHTAYNVARVGQYVVCNSAFADRNITEIYTKMGYKIINVRQGYAKCNLCIINDSAVITEDRGIAKALSEYGIDVLRIDVGGVRLKGFEYGFIGGASGNVEGKLLFSGKIENHPMFDDILNFLNKYGIIYLSLGNNSLCDYGSILEF